MTDTSTEKLAQEKKILEAIKELWAELGYSPTVEEIQARAGMTYGTTYLTMERLQDKNKIIKTRGKSRSIQIVKRTRKKKAA